jgi:lipase chaperone LimK
MAYKPEAIDKAFRLFCQGEPHEAIEAAMKKEYPAWSRQLLYGEEGWIKKYNWEERRAKADAKKQDLTDAIENTEELMVKAITSAITSLSEKIETQGSQVNAQDLAQLNKLSGTLNNIRKRMDMGGGADKPALFIEFLTGLVGFLKEKDADYAEQFEMYYLDEFIERIKG